MINDIPLGVGIIPDSIFTEKIYSFMHDLAQQYDFSFSIAPGVSIPHLTLFQGRFNDENEVIKRVSSVGNVAIKKQQSLQGLSVWAEKILFLDCIKTPDLQETHNQIFEKLFPLCLGTSADPQSFIKITDGQRKSYRETGYPFSLEEYLPHFTLAHFKESPRPETLKDIQEIFQQYEISKEVIFETMVIYRVGEKGRCNEIIYKIDI